MLMLLIPITYYFIKEIETKTSEVGKTKEEEKPINFLAFFSILGVAQLISMCFYEQTGPIFLCSSAIVL